MWWVWEVAVIVGGDSIEVIGIDGGSIEVGRTDRGGIDEGSMEEVGGMGRGAGIIE